MVKQAKYHLDWKSELLQTSSIPDIINLSNSPIWDSMPKVNKNTM